MEIFKNIPETWIAARNTARKRVLLVMAIAFPVSVALPIIKGSLPSDPITVSLFGGGMLILLAVVFAAVSLMTNRSIEAAYCSFELKVGEQEIVREQKNLPELTLARSDIRKIETLNSGEILIRGAGLTQQIVVAAGIERREELLRLLAEIVPVGSRKTLPLLPIAVAVIAGIALPVGYYLSPDPLIRSLCGGVLAFAMLLGSVYVFRMGRKAGWLLFISALLMLPGVLAVIYNIYRMWS